MKEIWKDISGFEGLYQVSNLGNVRSLDRKTNTKILHQNYVIKKGKIIKPHISKGYYAISLSKDNIVKTYRVHKIVAKTFIPNPHNKNVVNHINGNKLDNRCINLEWCSNKENVRHAYKIGLISTDQIKKCVNSMSEKRKKKVCQMKNGEVINTFESLALAEKETNITAKNISCVINGRTKRAGGYEWKLI